MPLLLDAAGTLLHPTEPVGTVYARHLEAIAGLRLDPDRVDSAFRASFARLAPPDYSLHPFGHAAEWAWWRDLVASVLRSLGPEPAAFAAEFHPSSPQSPAFPAFFEALFAHYASPLAWSLYPEVPAFLDAASRLGPLAVVSNFDDRLAPVLDGLGIASCFDHIITSADARARKPDPAIFTLALHRLKAAPSEAIHCGDSRPADFLGATSAGLRAYHLQRPSHSLLDFLAFCLS